MGCANALGQFVILVVSEDSNNSHYSKGNLAVQDGGQGKQINLKSKK